LAVTDEAIEKIKAMITSGALRAGDRLPREADLAADLGLSRSSLREAVRALSLVNILDVRRGDGTYVTSLEPRLLLEALSFIVDFHRDNTLLEFLRVRRILEPAATAMAAERITAEESDDLRALLDSPAPEAAPVRIATPTDGLAVSLRSRGTTIGTLLVGRPDGRPHAPEDVVLVADIARRAALAVQNAQSAAAHVAVSQALQQALLPRALPSAAGIDLASEYVPASRGTDVGGDFYDVLTLDSGQLLVSIGDVCGKGARAAARTGLVRDVLRVLVRGGRGLAEAVHLLNEVMMEAADALQFCTLATALVRRDGEGAGGLAVELLLAGHERPVVVRADGRVEQVGEYGSAVGLLPKMLVEVSTHRLEPGDTLLLYTDGVTERRRGKEQFGPERLLALAARTAGRPARQVVAAVRDAVERFSPDPATDDVALLAVRALPE